MIAGATLAALAIPEVLGYSRIAGMPVVTGLYTLLLPAVAFALLGCSRHLVVGADSATAAITFAALTPLAPAGSPEYVSGLHAGAHHRRPAAARAAPAPGLPRQLPLAHGAHRLSHRRRHLGRAGQLAGMFGLPKEGRTTTAHVYSWARDLTHTSPTAVPSP